LIIQSALRKADGFGDVIAEIHALVFRATSSKIPTPVVAAAKARAPLIGLANDSAT
jgi:hypothetical protein